MDEKTRSDALEEAWDAQDNSEEVNEPPATEVLGLDDAELQDGEIESGDGDVGVVDSKQEAEPEDESINPPDQVNELSTPPAGLQADARAEWANVPDSVKKAIHKREKDFEHGFEKYKGQAQKAQVMDKVFEPFNNLFRQNGVSPDVLTGQLLQTANVLQNGNPAAKASLIANMVKQFGVDVYALDAALTGNKMPEDIQRQAEIDQLLQSRVTPLEQELQQYRQREMQQTQQEQQQVYSEIQKFSQDPANKYYNDVRMEMADWMDMASKRGVQMSLKEAYDRACMAHPEISKMIQAEQATQITSRKRQASSSVYGTPAGSSNSGGSKDIRGALSAAFDNANRM